jgi:two-component system cell cycle sensor histidine kinase/response regulator CckA
MIQASSRRRASLRDAKDAAQFGQSMLEPRASDLAAHRRCLIVEDEPVLRRLVRGHLARKGYDVVAAASVADAKRALDEGSFDCLVTDAILPDGLGVELRAHVRASAPGRLVIMMSGDEGVGRMVLDLRDPRTQFLLKPFPMAALDAVLESHSAAR